MLSNTAAKRYKYSSIESSNNSMSSSSASPPLSPSPLPLGQIHSNKLNNKLSDFPNPYAITCNPYYSYTNTTPTNFGGTNTVMPPTSVTQLNYNYENYLLQQQQSYVASQYHHHNHHNQQQQQQQQQWSEAFNTSTLNYAQIGNTSNTQVSKSTDGSPCTSDNKENQSNQNDSLPLKKRRQTPQELRDKCYWDKRRKNNESAKRSRDQRKRKEDRIIMRNVILEQENLQLKTQVALYEAEIEKLRMIAYGMQTNGTSVH